MRQTRFVLLAALVVASAFCLASAEEPAPSNTTEPTPLQICVAAIKPEKKWACEACVKNGTTTEINNECLACVPLASLNATEWACGGVCANPSYTANVTETAEACTDCVLAGQPGLCQQCFPKSQRLAKALNVTLVDVKPQTLACLSCIQVAPKLSWACPACLSKPTLARVDACLECITTSGTPANPKAPWQCVGL